MRLKCNCFKKLLKFWHVSKEGKQTQFHSVHPPGLSAEDPRVEGGCLSLQQILQKGEIDRISIFRGDDFFQGIAVFI